MVALTLLAVAASLWSVSGHNRKIKLLLHIITMYNGIFYVRAIIRIFKFSILVCTMDLRVLFWDIGYSRFKRQNFRHRIEKLREKNLSEIVRRSRKKEKKVFISSFIYLHLFEHISIYLSQTSFKMLIFCNNTSTSKLDIVLIFVTLLL